VTEAPSWLPYRLLGASGRARLQQKLEGVVRRWLDAWGGKASPASSVRILDADGAAPASTVPCHTFRVRAGAATATDLRLYAYRLGVVLGVPLDRWSALTPHASPTGLSERLWNALARGLVNELMDSASIAAWELDALDDAAAAARERSRGPSQEICVAVGDEVVARGAHLEGALLAVEDRRPGVFRVRRGAPGAVLPDDVEVRVLERGDLRVGDVRLVLGLPDISWWH